MSGGLTHALVGLLGGIGYWVQKQNIWASLTFFITSVLPDSVTIMLYILALKRFDFLKPDSEGRSPLWHSLQIFTHIGFGLVSIFLFLGYQSDVTFAVLVAMMVHLTMDALHREKSWLW